MGCDVREYEQRFGKTLDEDVKIVVILALAPLQVQNHCQLNSHIPKSYAQVRTMLFDYCRARADTAAGDAVPMDLSMLGKGGKGKKGKGDKKGKSKGQGKKGESNRDDKDKGKDQKGKGKGENNVKAEYFAGSSLLPNKRRGGKKSDWRRVWHFMEREDCPRKRRDPKGRSVWDFTYNHEATGSDVWLKPGFFVFVRTTVATLNPVAIAKPGTEKNVRRATHVRKKRVLSSMQRLGTHDEGLQVEREC